MLSDHYSFPIEDLREHEPRPADIEWRAARVAQAQHDPHEHTPGTVEGGEGTRPTRKPLDWFALWFVLRRRRASQSMGGSGGPRHAR